MDHLSFFPFHKRHIKFLNNGAEWNGVVVDSIPYNKKEFCIQYVFISTQKMTAWKVAEKNRELVIMKEYYSPLANFAILPEVTIRLRAFITASFRFTSVVKSA